MFSQPILESNKKENGQINLLILNLNLNNANKTKHVDRILIYSDLEGPGVNAVACKLDYSKI